MTTKIRITYEDGDTTATVATVSQRQLDGTWICRVNPDLAEALDLRANTTHPTMTAAIARAGSVATDAFDFATGSSR